MKIEKFTKMRKRMIGKIKKFIEITEKNEWVIKLQFYNVGKSFKFPVHHLSQQYNTNGKWFHFSQIGSNNHNIGQRQQKKAKLTKKIQ